MIPETHCYACKRGMPAFMWGLHKWWYGCPGKTPFQYDQENGLIAGVSIPEWKWMWPGPLSRCCGHPGCHGGWIIEGMTSRKCPTCALWRHTFEDRLARLRELWSPLATDPR